MTQTNENSPTIPEETPFYVGVTGHRTLEHPAKTVYGSLKATLLSMKQGNPELVVITGMALGFDMLVADVCVETGIPFIAAIPCEGQEKFWGFDQKTRYKALIEKAQEAVVVSPGTYEAWKMAKRNQWIVDKSSVILTYWNGEEKSGTGMTLGMARKKGVPVMNLHNSAPVI